MPKPSDRVRAAAMTTVRKTVIAQHGRTATARLRKANSHRIVIPSARCDLYTTGTKQTTMSGFQPPPPPGQFRPSPSPGGGFVPPPPGGARPGTGFQPPPPPGQQQPPPPGGGFAPPPPQGGGMNQLNQAMGGMSFQPPPQRAGGAPPGYVNECWRCRH